MIREIGTLASGGVIGYAVCLLACWRKVQDANATLDRIANAGLDQIEAPRVRVRADARRSTVADVEMVPVRDLRVGDEVQGYGVLTRVAHHSWGTTVSSSRNWFHAPGVLCDSWPLDALVPVGSNWRQDGERPAT